MEIKEMVEKLGVTQAKFAEIFGIPKRSLENWCVGRTDCKDYLKKLLEKEVNRMLEDNKK